MNVWIGVGRLTADPEIRVASETQKTIARFSVAINRNKKDADFINCVAFDKTAELLEKYFHKGDRIGIQGRIQTGSYKNRDGQTVRTTEVMVSSIEFLQDKKAEAEPARTSYTEPVQQTFADLGEVDDDELPFK